jgi:hypothetical protein
MDIPYAAVSLVSMDWRVIKCTFTNLSFPVKVKLSNDNVLA